MREVDGMRADVEVGVSRFDGGGDGGEFRGCARDEEGVEAVGGELECVVPP